MYENENIVEVLGQPTKVKKMRKNGSLILGQEQDTLGGGFTEDQSFSGILSNMMIFDYELPKDQILQFLNCKPLNLRNSKPFVDFNDLSKDWSFNGSVKMTEESLDKICQSSFSKTYLSYSDAMIFMQAYDLCSITTGKQ